MTPSPGGVRSVVGVAVLSESDRFPPSSGRYDGRVLVARRGGSGPLAGRWEFPGGKADPGESLAAAACREMTEELGCGVEVTGWLDPVVPIEGLSEPAELRVCTARLLSGEPVPTEHDVVWWAPVDRLLSLRWLPADLPFAHAIADPREEP